jgi:hypothetical protein
LVSAPDAQEVKKLGGEEEKQSQLVHDSLHRRSK